MKENELLCELDEIRKRIEDIEKQCGIWNRPWAKDFAIPERKKRKARVKSSDGD